MEASRRRLVGLLLAATSACCGCDASSGAPAASSSTTQARVNGRATLKGKPLARAEIRFNPANVNRKTAPIATATIASDGSYEVTTLVGDNSVTLGGPSLRKNPQLQYTAKTINVKEGDNTFDLVLP